MRLSSGVIWRHREFDRFRAECPAGDERLQRLLFERLDADLRWLEGLGAPVAAADTGKPAHHRDPLRPGAAHSGARRGRRQRQPALRIGSRRRPGRRAAGPGHRRVCRQPRSSAPARDPGGGPRAGAQRPGEHGRRAAARAGGRRGHRRRARRGLRPPDARRRPRVPAEDFVRLSQLYARHAEVAQRPGQGLSDRDLVGDRRGPVGGPPAAERVPGCVCRTTAWASACASAAWGRWWTRPRRPARPSGAAPRM